MAEEIKRSFIFYPEYISCVMNADEKKQGAWLKMIALYGAFGDETVLKEYPELMDMFNSFVKPKLDKSIENYTEKKEAGSKFGRKKIIDDEQIMSLAKKGLKAMEISN